MNYTKNTVYILKNRYLTRQAFKIATCKEKEYQVLMFDFQYVLEKLIPELYGKEYHLTYTNLKMGHYSNFRVVLND
ncbi:hypothetical protein XaC1_230 [Xanthomonas phage XaC1]|nr:hypothetical protein XaC1_230 [Xanthomonas phage XaC1]